MGGRYCQRFTVPVLNRLEEGYDSLTIDEKKEFLIDVLAFYEAISLGNFHSEHSKKLNNPLLLIDLGMNNTLCRGTADLKHVLTENTAWASFNSMECAERIKEFGNASIALEVLAHASDEVRTRFREENPELCRKALMYMKTIYETVPDTCIEEVNDLPEVEWLRLTLEEKQTVKDKSLKYFSGLRRQVL